MAQLLVSANYSIGRGVEKNDKEAFKWLSRVVDSEESMTDLDETGILLAKNCTRQNVRTR